MGAKYRFWATRPFSIMFNQGFCEYTIENGCKEIIIVPVGNNKADYIVDLSFDEACMTIGKKFIENADVLLEEYDKRKENVLETAKILSENVGKVSDAELLEIYNKYLEASYDFQPYMMFPHYSELILEPKLSKHLKIDIITSLGRHLEHMKMQRDLFLLSPEEVAEKYGWMAVYAMNEEPFKAEYFKKYKTELNETEVMKRYKEVDKNKEEYNKLNITDKEIQTLHDFVYIRTDRIDVWKKHAYILYPFGDYIAKKIDEKLNYVSGFMLGKKEIISILRGEKPVSSEELALRGTREHFMIKYSDELSFSDNKEEMKALRESVHKNTEEEVKGIPACKGRVTGNVVLYKSESGQKIEGNGYVMVCKHTSTQDLPNMRNAGAIITDEGGLTSHAAIVSREFNIPSIVGTKNATKLLKTGDKVEVDAEKGVVKKI